MSLPAGGVCLRLFENTLLCWPEMKVVVGDGFEPSNRPKLEIVLFYWYIEGIEPP